MGHDESSEGGKHDFLARLVTDWEKAALLPPGAPTRVVSLRSGVVLGRQGGLVEQTVIPFPEFVFKAVFGSERAHIITQSQVLCYQGGPLSLGSATPTPPYWRLLRSLHILCMKIR